MVSSQFEDIIESTRKELEDGGATLTEAMKETKELKRIMSELLDEKLDELEGRYYTTPVPSLHPCPFSPAPSLHPSPFSQPLSLFSAPVPSLHPSPFSPSFSFLSPTLCSL